MQLCKAEIVQKAIELISNSTLSNYNIAKDTGITEASIGNYRNGNTRPTLANANIIIDYFNKKELELSGSNLVINTETEYKEAMERTVDAFRGFTDCLENPKEKGIIYGVGAWKVGEIKETPAMDEAYKMGQEV